MRFFTLFILLSFVFNLSAQDSLLVDADKVYVSIGGSVFTTKGATVREIDRQGKVIQEYSLSPPVNIDFCDVSNPLEIVLFNRLSNRICILDTKMSPIYDNLSLFRDQEIGMVCSSSFGGLWLFDNYERQIFHSDYNGMFTMKTQPLYGIPEYRNDIPEMMCETRDYLYCDFPESGLMIFDRNLVYHSTLSRDSARLTYAAGDYSVFVKKGMVKIFNVNRETEVSINVPFSVKQAFIHNNELILFNGEKIFFKKLNKE